MGPKVVNRQFIGGNMVALLRTPASFFKVKRRRAGTRLLWMYEYTMVPGFPAIYRSHFPSPKSYNKPKKKICFFITFLFTENYQRTCSRNLPSKFSDRMFTILEVQGVYLLHGKKSYKAKSYGFLSHLLFYLTY